MPTGLQKVLNDQGQSFGAAPRMQATGPVNQFGVMPTNRSFGGQQAYATPQMMASITPASNQNPPGTRQQRLEAADRANPNPFRPSEEYTHPDLNQTANQELDRRLEQFRSGDPINAQGRLSMMTSPGFRSGTYMTNLQQQLDQREVNALQQMLNREGGNAPRTVNYPGGVSVVHNAAPVTAQASPQDLAYMRQQGHQQYLNSQVPEAMRGRAVPGQPPASSADRDAWFRDLMARGTTENNRFRASGQTAATPLMDQMFQGSPWGNNVREVGEYFNRIRTY